MAESTQPEIMLRRLANPNRTASTGEDESPETAPKRVRKQPSAHKPVERKTSRGGSGKKKGDEKRPVDSDERLRQVVGVLMALVAVLTLFALISYTPHDQANADVRTGDLVGLFTNDPVISARADTTENWLGLLGAFVANFLINSTIGYMTLFVPLLIGMWSVAVFRGREYKRATRITLYTLGIMTLVAALFGTIQTVEWLPHPAHEWAGSVGAFIASILSGLLGSIGGFLLLMVALFLTVIYSLNIDVKTALNSAMAFARTVQNKAVHTKEVVSARLGEQEKKSEEGAFDEQSATVARPRGNQEDEPARMMRRIPSGLRGADDMDEMPVAPRRNAAATEQEVPPQEPKISRLDRSIPLPGEELTPPATQQAQRVDTANVELRHNDPEAQPPAPTPDMRNVKLTVNVQEGETDADIETEDDGDLIGRIKDEQIKYEPPSIDQLVPQSEQAEVDDEELKENARLLQEKLRTFNIEIENLTVTPGPVVTLYEFVPAAGIKISQIESLTDDIALALKARGIRIIAPIPGKGTVGVEIPNHHPAMVRIRSVINTTKFREASARLPLALGKTTIGEVFCDDLAKMPHLLIAGSTGSGKSVGINSILASLIYKMHPSDLKLAIIDPKKIELTQYRALKDHFLARCPDIDEDIVTNPLNAVMLLKSLELEMDRRYDILAKVGQRNIADYNSKLAEGKFSHITDFHHAKMPNIVLIVDELADLMITAAKEVEEPIARLAQLARAIGIHLIVATQRPSVDVITGVIKANFPARIAYQVASKIDSRTILDMNGAEQLLGNGDMLYLPGGQPKPVRLQNAFISTEEVERMCEHVGNQKGYTLPYMLPSVAEKKRQSGGGGGGDRDELFNEAAHLVVRHQQGSVSLIQRRLKVGYARAARIVDELEDAGIVGPFDGSKARQVILESEAELEAYL